MFLAKLSLLHAAKILPSQKHITPTVRCFSILVGCGFVNCLDTVSEFVLNLQRSSCFVCMTLYGAIFITFCYATSDELLASSRMLAVIILLIKLLFVLHDLVSTLHELPFISYYVSMSYFLQFRCRDH